MLREQNKCRLRFARKTIKSQLQAWIPANISENMSHFLSHFLWWSLFSQMKVRPLPSMMRCIYMINRRQARKCIMPSNPDLNTLKLLSCFSPSRAFVDSIESLLRENTWETLFFEESVEEKLFKEAWSLVETCLLLLSSVDSWPVFFSCKRDSRDHLVMSYSCFVKRQWPWHYPEKKPNPQDF